MPLPITSVILPTTLKGQTNGKLPAAVLKTFVLDDGDNVVAEITAARAFQAMFAQARKDLPGLKIREVGGYRSYEGQLSLFLSRYKPVSSSVYNSTSSKHRKYWSSAVSLGYSSNYWVKKDNSLATAAVPGTSNHGWGLAIDIAENTDADSSPEGITSRFVTWLTNNAATYGISAELQSEPWHWRYVAGDNVPAAVLEFEGGTNPNPPNPNPEEDDMLVLNPPARVYDSREDDDGAFRAGESRDIVVGKHRAVFVNVTVTQTEGPGHMTAFGGNGWSSRPNVSNLNWSEANTTICNTSWVPVHKDHIHIFMMSGGHVIVDVQAAQAL